LPDLKLSTDEQLALGFALAAVRLEGSGGRDALAKLGSPDVPDLPPVAVLPSLPALGPLQDAIRRHAIASFSYHRRPREVEPYGLCFRSGAWYLVGKDRAAGELRTFRVDRIEDAEPAIGRERAFEPPADLDMLEVIRYVPWQARGEQATEVIVDVDRREARAAVELVGTAAVEQNVNGTLRLRFRIGDEEGFLSWLVGLGDAAELVSPPGLRARVVERLQSFARRGGS
jgi:proteasome accessory factor B